MADRVEALVLQMSVDLRKLQKDMDKAKRTTSAGLSDVEGRFSKTSKKVKEEAGKMGSAFEDMARGIPVVGNAIADLGPAWTIAGAGAAALGLALKTVWDNAEQARKKIDDLGTSAENVSVSAESFQAFKALGVELDVTFETIEKGLNKLQVGAAEAQVETGALYNGLKKVDPALLAVIQSAETQEDRWDALSQAITGTDDQLKKVAIAKAAFGKEGAKFVRLLEGEDKTVAALTNRYRELGLILSEDLVRQVGAADQRLQLASARLDALKTRADAAWIPAVEAVTSAWLELNVALAQTFDRMNDLQGRQTDTLIADMKAQEVALDRAMKAWGEAEKNLSKYDQGPGATKEGIRKRAAMEVQQLRDDFYKEQARFFELRNLVNDRTQKINKGAGTNGELADQAAADAALEAEQRRVAEMAKLAAERDRQRQQAAQYLNELGDSTELLKIREEDLAKIVAAGFLTRQQADASLSAYAKSIDKVTDAEKEAAANAKIWASILEQAKTPVDRATEALGEFWDGIKYGQVPAADAAQILAILTKNLQDAEAAARGATPALQAVAAARAAIAEAENMSLSRAERLAKERKRLDDLVGQGGFTQKEADRSFKLFADQDAGQVRDAMRESVKTGIREGIATDDWGTQLRNMLADSVVNGLDDAITRLADVLTDLVLGKPGGDGGFLATAAKFVFGGARANGGGVNPNRDYLVGEKGPEILRMGPGQSGQVLNANQVNSLAAGGGGGGGAYIDARIAIGGVDMATWPQVRAALDAQARAIAARMPGAVNATLASNRRQKRRY